MVVRAKAIRDMDIWDTEVGNPILPMSSRAALSNLKPLNLKDTEVKGFVIAELEDLFSCLREVPRTCSIRRFILLSPRFSHASVFSLRDVPMKGISFLFF